MGEPGADAGKSICGDVNEQRSNEEGESEEQSERVADEQGEREEAARKRNWTLRIERLREGEGREDGVGEVGRLEEGVVGEEMAPDGSEIGDEVRGAEEVDESAIANEWRHTTRIEWRELTSARQGRIRRG